MILTRHDQREALVLFPNEMVNRDMDLIEFDESRTWKHISFHSIEQVSTTNHF